MPIRLLSPSRKGDRIYHQLRKLGSSLDWDRACFTMDPVSGRGGGEAPRGPLSTCCALAPVRPTRREALRAQLQISFLVPSHGPLCPLSRWELTLLQVHVMGLTLPPALPGLPALAACHHRQHQPGRPCVPKAPSTVPSPQERIPPCSLGGVWVLGSGTLDPAALESLPGPLPAPPRSCPWL